MISFYRMNYFIFSQNDLGQIPPTPLIPLSQNCDVEKPKKVLLSAAQKYGHPISFIQEQNGVLIQNILPVHKTESEQISTSSKVELALHTETAFHPHKPDYVLLLCLRGDPNAVTTLADIDDIISELDDATIDCLMQPWYKTEVDKSFRKDDEEYSSIITSILKSENKIDSISCTYDYHFMKGTNDFAQLALDIFRDLVVKNTKEIVLNSGDLLVIDNNKVVHGRKPFQARYDGTDRWVQRMLVKKNIQNVEHITKNIVDEFETFLIQTPTSYF